MDRNLGIFLHVRASWNIIASGRVLLSRPASTGTDQWIAFTDNSIHNIPDSKRSPPHHFCIWFYYCSEGQRVSSLVYDGALLAAAATCYLNMEKICSDLLYHATRASRRNDPRAHRLLSEGLRYSDTSPSVSKQRTINFGIFVPLRFHVRNNT